MDTDNDAESIFEVFTEYGDYLSQETATKEKLYEVVKCVEKESRRLYNSLQYIHRPGANIPKIVEKCEAMFTDIHAALNKLDEVIPADSYWRYQSVWNNSISWLSFLGALILYLKTDALPEMPQVTEMIGLKKGKMKSLRLDIEEYLLGLCQLCNELSRLAVNSVTNEDYQRPLRIKDFLNALYTGFRMLNLKNDNLRKRFDSIKYDLKKVEEVVYDLSIRKLCQKPNPLMEDESEENVGEKEEIEKKEAEKEKKEAPEDPGVDEVDPEQKIK
jgi:predicted translin family RNA/ssDNA-binding protein